MIGASDLRKDIINLIFNSPILLIFSTYGILILELILALSIFINSKNVKNTIFKIGIIFHVLIFLMIGIFSFALAMVCALMLLHLQIDKNFNTDFVNAITSKMKT